MTRNEWREAWGAERDVRRRGLKRWAVPADGAAWHAEQAWEGRRYGLGACWETRLPLHSLPERARVDAARYRWRRTQADVDVRRRSGKVAP